MAVLWFSPLARSKGSEPRKSSSAPVRPVSVGFTKELRASLLCHLLARPPLGATDWYQAKHQAQALMVTEGLLPKFRVGPSPELRRQ